MIWFGKILQAYTLVPSAPLHKIFTPPPKIYQIQGGAKYALIWKKKLQANKHNIMHFLADLNSLGSKLLKKKKVQVLM